MTDITILIIVLIVAVEGLAGVIIGYRFGKDGMIWQPKCKPVASQAGTPQLDEQQQVKHVELQARSKNKEQLCF